LGRGGELEEEEEEEEEGLKLWLLHKETEIMLQTDISITPHKKGEV
jgi:hypothetical protein